MKKGDGYPCAITRGYTSSTQSRDALRVHPRLPDETPSLHRLFPGSHHPLPPLSIVLPPPTNSYNYVHVPIHNPPPSTLHPSVERSTSPFPNVPVLSLSFLPSLPLFIFEIAWERRQRRERRSLGTSIYLSLSYVNYSKRIKRSPRKKGSLFIHFSSSIIFSSGSNDVKELIVKDQIRL